MWQPYLKVIRKKAPWALNILDRFHIMKKFNKAIDTIRREEYRLNYQSQNHLKNSRWILLKREENLTAKRIYIKRISCVSGIINIKSPQKNS